MGNQPSTPQPVPPTPLPPVCDSNCQKQKLLTGLKTNLDQKEQTKSQDPEGYEQARIAYNTALYGDTWIAGEKQRIAKDEISPRVTAYTTQYEDLKKQQSSQQVFVNLANALQAQESSDEKDLQFLKKQVEAEKDKAAVLNRLTVLGSSPTDTTSSYMPIVLDIIVAILGLVVLYLLYTKLGILKRYFGYTSSEVVGGKRLRN